MAWNFSADKPIFQQIMDVITADIIRGKYKPGEKLAAVRDLALEAGVNPNTMQRALSEIESTGLISTKRGDGRYVTEDEALLQLVTKNYVAEKTNDFIDSLRILGLDDKQITMAVEQCLK